MHLKPLVLVLGLVHGLVAVSTTALADDGDAHFSGEPAETLEQALANLRDYGAELSTLIGSEGFGTGQLHEVHEMTYTLENALETLRSELSELAETLESVHVASEQGDLETVRRDGDVFTRQVDRLLMK